MLPEEAEEAETEEAEAEETSKIQDPAAAPAGQKQKKSFFEPTLNDWPTPSFQRNLTTNAPYFRSSVDTCTSLSYSSAPPEWN